MGENKADIYIYISESGNLGNTILVAKSFGRNQTLLYMIIS